MGYSLYASRPINKDLDCYLANIFDMEALRQAMKAAGVNPAIIRGKLSSNDGHEVTQFEAISIFKKLTIWLRKRGLESLNIDCGVTKFWDETALKMNEKGLGVLTRGLMPTYDKKQFECQVSEFAKFCRYSGGFGVW